jgi:hypothetical protein
MRCEEKLPWIKHQSRRHTCQDWRRDQPSVIDSVTYRLLE